MSDNNQYTTNDISSHVTKDGQQDVDEQVAAAAGDEGRRGGREEDSDLNSQGEQRLSCGPLSRTRMRRTSEPLTGMVA